MPIPEDQCVLLADRRYTPANRRQGKVPRQPIGDKEKLRVCLYLRTHAFYWRTAAIRQPIGVEEKLRVCLYLRTRSC